MFLLNMQVYKNVLASTQPLTIAAGFTGSLLYVFLLTAVANLEKSVFGWNFQTKLGEVIFQSRNDSRVSVVRSFVRSVRLFVCNTSLKAS